MSLLQMGDSSTPPGRPTLLPVYAFEVYGDTPHAWSPPEVRSLDARWGLPIAVNTNPQADPEAFAQGFTAALAEHRWPSGVTVAIDTEDTVQPEFLPQLDGRLRARGWDLVHYESQDVQGSNPATSGGKWIANWNGPQALPAGCIALQYADATMDGDPWDLSVISSTVRLHEIHPVVTPVTGAEYARLQLPVLQVGQSGYAVLMLQSMLAAALGAQGNQDLADGIYGLVTRAAVAEWQHLYGLDEVPGVAGAVTWESLLTRS